MIQEDYLEGIPPEVEPLNIGADFLKFILMPFVCFWAFGFPEPTGLVSVLSGFAVPAFFVLTGYFVLVMDPFIRDEKIVGAMVRSLITFFGMLIIYMLLNVVLMQLSGMPIGQFSRREIFNFVVLNVWPFSIGSNIWFIQSLFYVWVFMLFLHRTGLLRFYKVILVLTVVFMLLTGEFAAVIRFHFLGYGYFPGGALTRALPYVLLGMLMREYEEKIKNIKLWVYAVVFAVGTALSVGEVFLLGHFGRLIYTGHMLGFILMAFAAVGAAVSHPKLKETSLSRHGHAYAKRIYALANPVYYVMALFVSIALPSFAPTASKFSGFIVYFLCLLLCMLFTLIKVLLHKAFKPKEPEVPDGFGGE